MARPGACEKVPNPQVLMGPAGRVPIGRPTGAFPARAGGVYAGEGAEWRRARPGNEHRLGRLAAGLPCRSWAAKRAGH